MNTIGKDKWPVWVKKIFGKRKCIEIKEDRGRYYAYEYKCTWDKEKKTPVRKSKYLGVVKQTGIHTPHEVKLNGIYEYGHIEFIWNLLEKNNILQSLKKIFPDDWKILLVFAMNRLIDPRPIKSIHSWHEKTYLVKKIGEPISPKIISRVLETAGMSWKSQTEFFQALKKDGEKILYDGSVIFSSSKDNPIVETGYNKEHLLLTKSNIVLAFSCDRFLPIFFRLLPGSIHEISSINILLEELGKKVILIIDKGFFSFELYKNIFKKVGFITPLRRNSDAIKYSKKFDSYFIYRDRPIKHTSYKHGKYYIYLYEDLALKIEEERTYFMMLSQKKKANFKENWAGKIAIISNRRLKSEDVYEMWKSRDNIEKVFDVFQNLLDVDKPYVQKEETFRGYIFASFIGLISYYLILNILKKAEVNNKVSVSDLLLELSKIYKLDVGKKELTSERSKTVRDLIESLKIENLITN